MRTNSDIDLGLCFLSAILLTGSLALYCLVLARIWPDIIGG